MPLFRRRETLHERMAREGGLELQPHAEPAPPGWMETGIHGVPRAREWDAVVAIEPEGAEGDRARFVALPGDTLIVEEGGDVDAIAAALDGIADPPYRADANRRSATQWVVGLRRIAVVELPDDPGGAELTLTVHDGSRTVDIDGARTFATIPELEELGAVRGAGSFVVQARRLEGATWEVEVMPL